MITCSQEDSFAYRSTIGRVFKMSSANNKKSSNLLHIESSKKYPDNSPHCDKREIWTPDVEKAFFKALESIPVLGRRKLSLNGKACGRNELISDFIYRKTSKIRTRKQVSSHIQVLKNTYKDDPKLIELLTGVKPSTLEFPLSNTPNPPNLQNNISDPPHSRSTSVKGISPSDLHLSFWPAYICFYQEQSSYDDSLVSVPHTMAVLPEFRISSVTSSIKNLLASHKKSTNENTTPTLHVKVNLNLDLRLTDFVFNNTCIFESQDRCTIECTTCIYSFDNLVLKSEEIQQALYVDEGKFLYNFHLVDQFFDALIKGIQDLAAQSDIDKALHNIKIVQEFKDFKKQSKILVIVYEFLQGKGTIGLEM